MIRRRTLLTTALAATAAIGLAACSDDTDGTGSDASDGGTGLTGSSLDGVTIGDDLGAEPTVEFTPPLTIDAADATLVVTGDGDALAEGDVAILRSMYVDASTGETLQSWWQGASANTLTLSADAIGDSALAFFQTVTVGSRFAMAGWQTDTSGTTYSLVQVADVDRVIPSLRAEGEAQEVSGDFPTVTLAEDGAPSLDSTPTGDAPTETVREVLIQGTGDVTQAGDYLTMAYTGWQWSDGTQFDSSWDAGTTFSFTQGASQVIPGWDDHLLDLAVGSQVMLVIPPADAYGTTEEGSTSALADQTLIFVIDVLDAARPYSA
ncbi:FKBP-type peptidyl-prolyl cis-trans isomerase [Brachybacterium sp. DNPG3]